MNSTMASLFLATLWLLSSTDVDLTQAGDLNYLPPHSASDFAPMPTVTVPFGHGTQSVFMA